jgi:hypothetical protein
MSSISRSSESSSIIVSFQANESKNEKKYFDVYLPCVTGGISYNAISSKIITGKACMVITK